MTFKIHFTVNDVEDYIIISGETIDEIKLKAKQQTDMRGLEEIKNNLWSEEVKE
jgi:hypothetical protein